MAKMLEPENFAADIEPHNVPAMQPAVGLSTLAQVSMRAMPTSPLGFLPTGVSLTQSAEYWRCKNA